MKMCWPSCQKLTANIMNAGMNLLRCEGCAPVIGPAHMILGFIPSLICGMSMELHSILHSIVILEGTTAFEPPSF